MFKVDENYSIQAKNLLDYLSAIEDEVKQLKLNFEINGQFIEVFQPDFSYNDLMTLVDEIETKKIKLFQNVVKLKWIQLSDLRMQSKMNLLILRLQEKLQIIVKKCSKKMRKS